jgi:hypothetical protein
MTMSRKVLCTLAAVATIAAAATLASSAADARGFGGGGFGGHFGGGHFGGFSRMGGFGHYGHYGFYRPGHYWNHWNRWSYWNHHYRWYWRDGRWFADGGYEAPAPVAAPESGPVAAPASCTCLTKTYTQEGLVVFADVCTKESAAAPVNGQGPSANAPETPPPGPRVGG